MNTQSTNQPTKIDQNTEKNPGDLMIGCFGVFYSLRRLGNTELNVKAVLLQIIQLSINTQFRCQNSSILNNSV